MVILPSTGWTFVSSHDTIRPGATFGATVTPGNNTYGSYATVLGTPTPADAYGILITIHGIGTSTAITDSLCTIGIDPAGGTSYADFIPHLLVSGATTLPTIGGGIDYYFPIRIPAGSTIGAKGSINNATVGTQTVAVKLYTRPSSVLGIPRYGTFVTAFGVDTANSCGTAVTAGGASEGTYTQLGSAIAGSSLFYWNVAAMKKNSGAWNTSAHHIDLAVGDASNKIQLIQDQRVSILSTEMSAAVFRGEYGYGPIGALVYARIQTSGADTAQCAIAYGVGG